jgi:hypothetical protein
MATNIFLRNDSGGTITIGTLSILSTASVEIWDTVNYASGVISNFIQIVNNIAIFNENIGNGNLVLVVDTVDQLVQPAFDQFQELLNIYNQNVSAGEGFSILKLENEISMI